MSDDTKGMLIGFSLACITIPFIVWGLIANINKDRASVCEAYCECQITKDCNYTFDYNEVKACSCVVDKEEQISCGYVPTIMEVTNQKYPCKYQTSSSWSDGGNLMERVNVYFICDIGIQYGEYRSVNESEYSITQCPICIFSDCPVEEYHNSILDMIR